MKTNYPYQIPLLFIFIISLILIMTHCIDLDPDSNDKYHCDKTFYESEVNDPQSKANDIGTFLKTGCKVTIYGSVGNGEDDYFRFNTGTAYSGTATLTWDSSGGDDLDVYLYDYYGGASSDDFATGLSATSPEIRSFIFSSNYVLRYLNVFGNTVAGNASYKLVFEGKSY